jgi:hypothetical protein
MAGNWHDKVSYVNVSLAIEVDLFARGYFLPDSRDQGKQQKIILRPVLLNKGQLTSQ